MRKKSLAQDIENVVREGNCSGCGACAQISPDVKMGLSERGYMRPIVSYESEQTDDDKRKEFSRICPGRRVEAPKFDKTASWHPIFGSHIKAWEAWANDAEIRYKGSSGGAITALTSWLLETKQLDSVVGAAAEKSDPRRTVSLELMTREDAIRAAGSRYAPVSNAALYESTERNLGFVGKPCEASAVRALSETRNEHQTPLVISFFCAGVPNQFATENLIRELGVGEKSKITQLRYRGYGWPGKFYARDAHGNEGIMSYDESWGKALGPTTQWRCKICPDGIGQNADIVAGDYWHADSNGYPIFADGEGISVLIARSARGASLINDAIESGILSARPINLDEVEAVQPLQVDRRTTLVGRLLGQVLSGRRIPVYRRFGTARLAARHPYRNLRAAAGTFVRARTTVPSDIRGEK